jgi:hypothetical protein
VKEIEESNAAHVGNGEVTGCCISMRDGHNAMEDLDGNGFDAIWGGLSSCTR